MSEFFKLVFVAICEEFFFRGFLLDIAINKYKRCLANAALGVSGLFGLLHVFNVFSYASWGYVVCQIVFAFGISMMLCWLYIRLRNIILCIIIHSLINMTSIFTYKVNESGLEYIALTEALCYIIFACLCTFISYKNLKN